MHSEQTMDQLSETSEALCPAFFDALSGDPIASDEFECTADDLFVGNVLTLRHGGNKRHYRITTTSPDPVTDEDDAPVVYLTPAKSQLKKTFLLFALLAAFWFVIKYAVLFIQNLF